jgi:glycosyltransferase involved in cell wall biosynthesis
MPISFQLDAETSFQRRPEAAPPVLSLITPAYNEAQNLPVLYQRICKVFEGSGIAWEWIVVDDHSSDTSFAVVNRLAQADPRVHAVRFARNFGSHCAITFGLHHARGACGAVLAADLQDPPETLPQLMTAWRNGAQVVWAVRNKRDGEARSTVAFARFYYWLMRNVVGIKEMSGTGADFFLLDRAVLNAFREFRETNVSILALITWMGFRQESILYTKESRLHGVSGWSLEKKLKLLLDSVTSFTYLPIRLMSYTGFVVAFLGFCYACFVAVNAIVGKPVEGWTSLMIVVMVIGGLQMLMLGTLGEYVWRSLDESRRRPRYLVEAASETFQESFPKKESANECK